MATIKEIANLANVSSTTVSRVLNCDESFSVSKETRNKILSIAKELGYQTLIERHYQKQKIFYRFGLIYNPMIFRDFIDSDYYFSIRKGIEHLSLKYNIELVNNLVTAHEKTAELQGVIILGNYSKNVIDNFLEDIETKNVVIIGNCPDDNKFDSVWFHTRKAVLQGLEYLQKLGHQTIGYIGAKEHLEIPEEDRREFIYKRHMERNGGFDSSIVYIGEPGEKSGYELMKKAIQSNKIPPAFFIANDPIAIGALKALNEEKLKVPKDISIVSLDGHPFTALTNPPLTTIQVPTEFMGATAIELLLERIEKERKIAKKVIVPTQLVKRDSCRNLSKS
ncbi:LacI family DNA-binding transcriptional regulator [Peribacillus loiseleuriae]|uniref:LacI family DNA-binding transcriptional regulator n=1 Tax=Peribacillus loiseleuriae TaxID=1679170 RepID=UPI0038282CBB